MSRSNRPSTAFVATRLGVVGLTVATAYIHSTLGGLMFTANAVGFAVLAVAMSVPLAIVSRYRWLIQLALGGFAAATIAGWVAFGARYSTGYLATGIEVAIVVLVAVGTYQLVGGPIAVVRRLLGPVGRLVGAGAAA